MKIQMTQTQYDTMREALILSRVELEYSLRQLKNLGLANCANGVKENLDKVNHALDTTGIWEVETISK